MMRRPLQFLSVALMAPLAVLVGLTSASPLQGQTRAAKGKKEAPAEELPEPAGEAASGTKRNTPVNLALIELRRGVQAAEKELSDLKSTIAKSAESHGANIAEETRKVASLRQEERQAQARLRELETELEQVDRKLLQASDSRTKAQEALDVTRDEIKTQAGGLKDRFRGSLAAIDDKTFVATAIDLERDSAEELPGRLATLLDLFARSLELARTVGQIEAPVQLAEQGGKIEKVDLLRLGLMGGYYSHLEAGDSGFVLLDLESKGGLRGESLGLTTAQKSQISALIKDPERGGLLPSDVSGGAGIAALRTRESLFRWFEMGGFAMWPLLAVAIAAFVLSIERAVALTLRTLGTQRKIERVLALVRRGQAEAAEAYCSKVGGAVGGVLHAALVHRHGGRSVMEDAVQEALLHHGPSFQSRLSFIALCAAVAPLFGLLGTVTGMITTFKMVTLFGTSDPRFMAGGISEALITTEAGLWIAIPSLLLRGMLGALADNGVGRLETGALSLVIALSRESDKEASVSVEEAA